MRLNLLDIGIIAFYLAAVTLFGLRFRSGHKSLKSYYLAGNTIPWWAIALSIVAAETSTLTVISIPGLAYDHDFSFLQLALGYVIGRIIVSFIFLPHYFRGNLVTAYQLMERRFGKKLRTLTAGIFLCTRAAAEGVRVFAVAIVVRVALGGLLSSMSDFNRDLAAIAIVTALTLIYTFEGGMKAAIWTDVLQQTVYVTGTIVGLFTILHLLPGGWASVQAISVPAGKFHVFDLSFNLTTKYTLWAGIIGGTFITMASHGTDQLIVQRLLSARSQAQAKLALISSGLAILFQFSLFLLIGAMLYAFYTIHPPVIAFDRSDTVFPYFVVSSMPHGISGLLIAAILAAAMSNLSAALNSLTSTSIVDFYARLRPNSSEQQRLRLSRLSMVLWALVLFALALIARHGGRVIEVGLTISSVAYGCLLGVFLLGVLTRTANERGAMVGMLCGVILNLYLWFFTNVAFTWYVVLGSTVTFAVGMLASLLLPAPKTS
ncbi:MAG: sodium:solute symporter [Terracidiphilus sp.]|nr:sodium:solute symporter [Terracidiphilus sp.]